MKEIILADPFRCRMWEFHDRLEQHVDERSCREEIESFLRHGQLVPALGRRLTDDPAHEVELIYGARRLFVARHLNKPLLVELRCISDSDAVIAMDIENRLRLNVSPYERGRSYLKWLHHKLFQSQDDIARELKISPSQVSRLIKLAQLPSVVVAAFKSPADICETWAHDLASALADPHRRERTCARARAIAAISQRPEPREIFRQMLGASVPGRRAAPSRRDQVVTGHDGKPLFRVRHLSNTIVFVLPMDRLPLDRLARVQSLVARAMEETCSTVTRKPHETEYRATT